jgi:ABC-type uncharacterized transport system substrate-binding protein
MISEKQTLQKLCNMLRRDNIESLNNIAEIETNEDMTELTKDQLLINHNEIIKENNQWLSDCNQKLRHLAAIAGK